MDYTAHLAAAVHAFRSSSEPEIQIRALLLVGAVLPRVPCLPASITNEKSLLGLAHVVETAQWGIMFDIANSAHKYQLLKIAKSIGKKSVEDLTPFDVLSEAASDSQRPVGEKLIWEEAQYYKFVKDFFANVGNVYLARSGQMVADYLMNRSGDFELGMRFGDQLGFQLISAISTSAFDRVNLFMATGMFRRMLPQFIATADGMTLSEERFVSVIGTSLTPGADIETGSQLMEWVTDEVQVDLVLDLRSNAHRK